MFYFWQQADSFWEYVCAILPKAIFCQKPDSTIDQVSVSGPRTLKVKTRVRTPLGLRRQTYRSQAKFGATSAMNRRLLARLIRKYPAAAQRSRLRRRFGYAGPCLSLRVLSHHRRRHAVKEPCLHLLKAESPRSASPHAGMPSAERTDPTCLGWLPTGHVGRIARATRSRSPISARCWFLRACRCRLL